MWFKFAVVAVVASLLMLGDGAFEVPLTKVTSIPKMIRRQPRRLGNKVVHKGDLILEGGTRSVHHSYLAEITINRQSYKLFADTGSSDLLVVGENCVTFKRGETCTPTTKPIGVCTNNPRKQSGTFVGEEGNSCFGIPGYFTFANYQVFKTDVTMAGAKASNQYLGYIYEQSEEMWGSAESAADGIIGLGYSSLSSIYNITQKKGDTLMATLAKENKFPNVLAMCFEPDGTGGKMVIGGGELQNMEFTPVILEAWFTVTMSEVVINGKSFASAKGLKSIVDSGTTNLIVPGKLMENIAETLCPLLKRLGSPCDNSKTVPQVVSSTAEKIGTLPKITIKLPGVTLVVPPQSYFGDVGRNMFVYGIDSIGFYEITDDSVAVILGDVALMGYWVYFDAEGDRVGFTSVTDCNQKY